MKEVLDAGRVETSERGGVERVGTVEEGITGKGFFRGRPRPRLKTFGTEMICVEVGVDSSTETVPTLSLTIKGARVRIGVRVGFDVGCPIKPSLLLGEARSFPLPFPLPFRVNL